jgi:ATP dependent DNA ligase domain
MKVLLTGGSGDLGQTLVPRLLDRGDTPVILDVRPPRDLKQGAVFIEGSILDWLHEIKFDGYRLHARLDHGAVKLLTRTGLDWTHKYPAIAKVVATLGARQAYLDGELCGVFPDVFQHDPGHVGRRQRGRAGLFHLRSSASRRRRFKDFRSRPLCERKTPGKAASQPRTPFGTVSIHRCR